MRTTDTTSRRSSENPTNSGARDVPRSPEPEPDRWADAHHAGHAADRSLEQGHALPSVSVSLINAGGPRHRVPGPPGFNGARRLRIIGSRQLAGGRISRQPIPRAFSPFGDFDLASKSYDIQPAMARLIERPQRSMLWRKGHYWSRSVLRARKVLTTPRSPWQHWLGTKVRGGWANDFGGGVQRARGRMSSDV
jgi:hypothetical protein